MKMYKYFVHFAHLNTDSMTETKLPTKGFSLSIFISVCIIVLRAVSMISLMSEKVLPTSFLNVRSNTSDKIFTQSSTCAKIDKKIFNKTVGHTHNNAVARAK